MILNTSIATFNIVPNWGIRNGSSRILWEQFNVLCIYYESIYYEKIVQIKWSSSQKWHYLQRYESSRLSKLYYISRIFFWIKHVCLPLRQTQWHVLNGEKLSTFQKRNEFPKSNKRLHSFFPHDIPPKEIGKLNDRNKLIKFSNFLKLSFSRL